jgi:hypothetical protein
LGGLGIGSSISVFEKMELLDTCAPPMSLYLEKVDCGTLLLAAHPFEKLGYGANATSSLYSENHDTLEYCDREGKIELLGIAIPAVCLHGVLGFGP